MSTERDVLKRAAESALLKGARTHLVPLGLRPQRRGARYWYADRTWWRINVWFEPGRSVSAALRVGVQTYWRARSTMTIQQESRRTATGPGRYVSFENNPKPDEGADALARLAAEGVIELDERFGDDATNPILHLPPIDREREMQEGRLRNLADLVLARRLAGDLDDCVWLLDHQRSMLDADPFWRSADSGGPELYADLEDLTRVVHAADHLEAIAERIDRGRVLLGQEPMTQRPPWLNG